MTKQKNKLEILIVDDNPKYLGIAKEACNKLQKKVKFNVEYCNNFEGAIKEIETNKYNRCVTDLFESANAKKGLIETRKIESHSYLTDSLGNELPKGLAVYLKCIEKNIPVGILTDGDRHAGSLGCLRSYLMGKEMLNYLIEEGKDTSHWYNGKRLVEKVVNPKELFAALSKIYLKEKEKEINSRYEDFIERVRLKGPKNVCPDTDLSAKEYIEVLKKQQEKALDDSYKKAPSGDPLAEIDGFIIGKSGTNKLEEKNWKVAIQRILEDKKDRFYW